MEKIVLKKKQNQMGLTFAKAAISAYIGDGVLDRGHTIYVECVECFSMFETREGYRNIKGIQQPKILCPTCLSIQQKKYWEQLKLQATKE